MDSITLRYDNIEKEFYLYQSRPTMYGGMNITENKVLMERYTQLDKNIEYWKPAPNQSINVAPIMSTEIGNIYHGTDMLSEKPNRDTYMLKLYDYYGTAIDEAQNNISKYNRYRTILQSKIGR